MTVDSRTSAVPRAVSAHPFLLIGLLTFALFLVVERFSPDLRASVPGQALAAVTRVLLVPMYLGWLLVSFAVVGVFGPSPSAAVAFVSRIVALLVGFAPYLVADGLLRLRKASVGEPAA